MRQTNIADDKLKVVSRMVASSTLEIGSRDVITMIASRPMPDCGRCVNVF